MRIKKFIITIVVIITAIIIWHLLVELLDIPTYIFPGPIDVFNSGVENRQSIFSNSAITLVEAILGFILANLISIFIALSISFYRDFEDAVMPVAIIIKTMPVIAITPLLIIWFGSGVFSKIMTAALICFFPALVNVLSGVKSLDKNLLALFKIYSANKQQLVQKFIFPSILPYLFSAFKTSSSLAVVGALVGEFIGSNRGLGFLIISNYYTMNTPLVFAAVIVANLIGIFFYYMIVLCEKQTVYDEVMIKE